MNTPLHLRRMQSSDLAFADAVRALAGWNQTPEDWRLLLASEPDGCFVAEWNGAPAGTATTTCYGTELAWIGMVLVHPDFRRRGIGKALLQHCLDHLRRRQIRCVKLDATPLGKTLYDQSGFRDEWTLTRWETSAARNTATAAGETVRPLAAADWEAVRKIDDLAFGVARHEILERLARRSSRGLIHLSEAGRVDGYGMLRNGSRAAYLGPVVAESVKGGTALMSALLAQAAGRPVFCNIPDVNNGAVDLIKSCGFTAQRPLIRMFLGDNRHPGVPQNLFSIAESAMG